jgi:peptidoglycan L-alanyl-D-glutamate endopeptidase CwlK
MPYFGKRSKNNLVTADIQLQNLFNEVIKYFDCTVIYGHRTPEEQLELFKNGRALINGSWVITERDKVVTNCDGYSKKSKHNYYPSKAVDVMPYPISWKDTDRMYMFVGFVRGIAQCMGIKVRFGADWDGDTQVKDQSLHDLPHFELI